MSPEFLEALPPNIQEEVLAQQRLEQHRAAVASALPDEPVDPGDFLQTLPPPLRQTVRTRPLPHRLARCALLSGVVGADVVLSCDL